jgi:hypothetical protein
MEDMSPPDHVGPPSAIHDLPGACLPSRRAKAGAAACRLPQGKTQMGNVAQGS